MFAKLAKLAARFKLPILIIWLAAAVSLFIFAPTLAKVGVTDDSQFLPANTESTVAEKMLNEKFASPLRGSAGSATIVVFNPSGLSAQNRSEGQKLAAWLVSKDAPAAISNAVSVYSNPALESSLVSQDQTAMIISLDLAVASSSASARQAMKDIRAYVGSQGFSGQIYLSGSAGISYDLLTSVQSTIDKATLVTVVLVFFLLMLIYRSPVAILVPLITIGISYLVSRGLAGYIAASGVNISSLADAYLVVTLFGIGTDYCLFMVSRFKEEVQRQDQKAAGEQTLKRIGPVILASATTVMVALLCLGISQFGMNRTSGYILAMGVAITLVAGLTLTPALISLFGKNLLWPSKLKQARKTTPGNWERIGRLITRRPALFAIPLIVVLFLPYLALPGMRYTADVIEQMPASVESVKGFNILRDHFPPGQLGPLYVVIQAKSDSTAGPAWLPQIAQLSQKIGQIQGVAGVDYSSGPASQLSSLSQQIKAGIQGGSGNLSQLTFINALSSALKDLALRYPGIVQSQNFKDASANLSQISTLSAQLMAGDNTVLPAIVQKAGQISDSLLALSAEFALQTSTPFSDYLRATYFSTDGSLAKIKVNLTSDPYSAQATTTLKEIRTTLQEALNSTFNQAEKTYVGGTTAVQSDIIAINDSDFLRVLILAIFGILLVTILLIRSVTAPLYMILTVLFNFGATLGIATWLFLDVLKQNSEIYMLPIFVFVMLVAVGSDYNIFLVSRIREENRTQPLREAICSSVANTGGVITSCGIILAGTFATLTTASLQLVFQVGAAIGIGVLIDTFLVRAILIPSLAAIVGKWNWWPSKN
jgi:putative drug exporter of the RND superfamily